MKIAVIGAGNVGKALATAWVRAGHEVLLGSREAGGKQSPVAGAKLVANAEAARVSDVVVLTVPWAAVPEVLKSLASEIRGKVLIDCTNPIGEGFQLTVGHTSSGGEQVAALAQGARVVKAFNTTGYENMQSPKYEGKPVTMLYATDDTPAQKTAEQLIHEVGFDPVFCGPLKQARYMEPLAMLWISMFLGNQQRNFAFTIVRR